MRLATIICIFAPILAACGAPPPAIAPPIAPAPSGAPEDRRRDANPDHSRLAAAGFSSRTPDRALGRSYRIAAVEIRFAAGAPLEWCEDDLNECGDVRRRIGETFEDGLARTGARAGARAGGAPVRAVVTVTRFDSLTRAERATPGGVHRIDAAIRLADMATGETLATSPDLSFHRIAFGGASARAALMTGRTQRTRIAEKIARVADGWLRDLARRS